jgi:hypothetical protein
MSNAMLYYADLQAIHRCSMGFPGDPRVLFPSEVCPALSHGRQRMADDNQPGSRRVQ